MAAEQVQRDIYYLAGHLPHRGANTDSERVAAEYLHGRLLEHLPTATIDDFYSPDNSWYLFVSYYTEFILVALVAFWWPAFAALYGTIVFLAFFAEYMGFQIMGRFLPHYETQNVLATLMNPAAEKTIAFIAHYDSGKSGPLSATRYAQWLNYLQAGAAPLMLLVVATCAVQAMTPGHELGSQILIVRWCAVATLLTLAGITGFNEFNSEFTVGANDNASGTAALLYLAEHLPEEITQNSTVHFAFTGSNQNWMSGARHFIRYHKLDKDTSYIVTLDSVGRGQLRYTTRLGMLQVHNCDKKLIVAAKAIEEKFGAAPTVKRAPDSDALPFLARGYKAIEITAAEAEPNPHDSLSGIDYDLVIRAAEFAREMAENLN